MKVVTVFFVLIVVALLSASVRLLLWTPRVDRPADSRDDAMDDATRKLINRAELAIQAQQQCDYQLDTCQIKYQQALEAANKEQIDVAQGECWRVLRMRAFFVHRNARRVTIRLF